MNEYDEMTIKYISDLRAMIDAEKPIMMKKCWCGDDNDACAYCASCNLNYNPRYCAECDTQYSNMHDAIRDAHEVMITHDGSWFISIGCEGFHRIKIIN